ncbi:MAG: ParA family protein [Oscillospiraceae bacterium]|nr:ParA family protein [Oscillospiraceae bacterium]
MKAIAIYNNKGGCGKSTSVINLAYHFSLDSRVLVIDTDGQSNTSRFFLDEPKSGLEKVLLGEIEAIKGEKTRYTNLDVISATAAINDVAGAFSGFSDKKQRELADRLVNANSDYDYIFVDLPPTMNDLTGQIIGACDYVFVPVELGIFSIQGIPKVTDVISKSKVRFGGAYVNKFDRKNRADIELFKMFSGQLGGKALNTTIPYSKVIKNSITYTLTAQEYMGWNNAGKAFGVLADEIRERIGE